MLAAIFFAGCASVPAGDPQSGYAIHGYVGQTTDTAAPGATVLLLDGPTDKALASTQANFMGNYKFTGLQPGHYKVKVNDKIREVVLAAENLRLDINLSAADGSMNYAEGAVEELTRAVAGAAGAPPGPNDPELASQIAGVWWGYHGSTETKIGLCEGGRFSDYSESSYSGRGFDSGGNETMAWGSASQGGGQGSWSIQGDADSGTISVRYDNGNTRTIEYRSCGEPGCLLFDGAKLCRSEGC
jgi:hypothetical protein